MTTEQIEEGGNNQYVHTVPGRITWTNIVLRRGVLTRPARFLDWTAIDVGHGFATAAATRCARTTGRGHRARRSGRPGRRLDLHRRIPGAVERSGVQRLHRQEMVAEEVEIAHHGLRVQAY